MVKEVNKPDNWNGDDSRIVTLGEEEWAIINYGEPNDGSEDVVIATSDDYLQLVNWFAENTNAGTIYPRKSPKVKEGSQGNSSKS